MPLQEGVGIDETLDAAFWRGLSEEVGIEVELSERGRLVNDQGQQFLGTRRLPADRHDRALRPVAPGLQDGHPLTMVKMRKKAYWALFRQVADSSRFVLTPNGTEVVDAEWVSLDEARNRITRSVPDDKRALLLKGVDTCARTFSGTALHIPDY